MRKRSWMDRAVMRAASARALGEGGAPGGMGGPSMMKTCPVVSEILDFRTQTILRENRAVAQSSDFCMSNKFVAQLLAMISENRSVKALMDEILSQSGASMNLKPADLYVAPAEGPLSFFQLA